MIIRIFAAVAATALITAPVVAQMSKPADYVAAAGAGDLYERRSSEMVLQSTQDPAIRRFATMMIEHHGQSTKDVVAAAKQAKVKAPPPRLMPAQAEMVAQLKAASGTARDQAYVTQQKQAHVQALALHQSYSTEGTAPPLRAAAAKIVPVVQTHIDMLTKM